MCKLRNVRIGYVHHNIKLKVSFLQIGFPSPSNAHFMDPRSPSYIRSPHCAQQGDASLTHWPSPATQLWWSVCNTRISCYIFTVAKKEHLCFVSRKKVVNHHCHEKEGFYSPSSSAPEIIESTYLCLLHAIIVMESGTLPSKLTRVV